MLGFPAITIRSSIERPEAMDTGSIIVTGIEAESVVRGVRAAIAQSAHGEVAPVPDAYAIRNTSQRVVNLILGLSGLSHEWSGVRRSEGTN